jgi:DinB superfamily
VGSRGLNRAPRQSPTTKEATMGARADMLAKQFEAKADELTDTIEALSEADWKKVTTAEKWSVGVTAHHVAGSHEPIAGMLKAVASGQTLPPFTMDMLNEGNAKHAKEFAGCTKAETLSLQKKGVASASETVRGLADADLDRTGTLLTGMPAMSVQQIIEGILINHIQEHLGSIKATVGR